MNNGTTGLGEYKDSELLAELVERGVIERDQRANLNKVMGDE